MWRKTANSLAISIFILAAFATFGADEFKLLSTVGSGQVQASGGSGDSGMSIISADGRFVLFASSARNLTSETNATGTLNQFPGVLNVFLRDRLTRITKLVSVSTNGVSGANSDSFPVDVSTNGQFVLFESLASDLVTGDTNIFNDIFVRDMSNGITMLVSVSTNGTSGNGNSKSPVMTPDGQFVVFASDASNLIASDTNNIMDVFIYHVWSNNMSLVSVGARSRGFGNLPIRSDGPEITPDGRYVVFNSTATNLVPDTVPDGYDVYVRDTLLGATTWVSRSVRTNLLTSNVICFNQLISEDGTFVAFLGSRISGTASWDVLTSNTVYRYNLPGTLTDRVYTNAARSGSSFQDSRTLAMSPNGRFLVYVANTNGTTGSTTCLQLWDGNIGKTISASGDASNHVPTYSGCHWPLVDSTGRYVAFIGGPTNLSTNVMIGEYHAYLRDILSGTTTVLNVDSNGIGYPLSPASPLHFSADWRCVAFDQDDSALQSNDINHAQDVFVRDLQTCDIELISSAATNKAGNTPDGPSVLASGSVSRDGRFVVFSSEADNLVPNDTNHVRDVFVKDLASGAISLVNSSSNGNMSIGAAAEPVITPDGRYVAFTSIAADLVGSDANGQQDVFIRDLQSGTISLISSNFSGSGSANDASYRPNISRDGRYVLFFSKAINLASGTFTGNENVFLHDSIWGTNYALTTDGGSTASMTPDGKFIVFIGKNNGNTASNLYVFDTSISSIVYSNNTAAPLLSAINDPGNKLALLAGTNPISLYEIDLAAGTNWTIASGFSSALHSEIGFSENNESIVYSIPVGGTNQVYQYFLQSGANSLLSHAWDSAVPGDGNSDSPVVSLDGRFVAYRSEATNLGQGISNGLGRIYIFDSLSCSNSLITPSKPENSISNARSSVPVLSGDGSRLFFQTWAFDFATNDFNNTGDIFGYVLLRAEIFPGANAAPGPWISWPWTDDHNYAVQYKDTMEQPLWTDLNTTITNNGIKAFAQDPTPLGSQRVYRVISY